MIALLDIWDGKNRVISRLGCAAGIGIAVRLGCCLIMTSFLTDHSHRTDFVHWDDAFETKWNDHISAC
jgi:hypothetical protein